MGQKATLFELIGLYTITSSADPIPDKDIVARTPWWLQNDAWITNTLVAFKQVHLLGRNLPFTSDAAEAMPGPAG